MSLKRPKPDQPDETRVACAVCRKEIPASEAHAYEVQDYVYYFCGAGCYDDWKKQAEAGYPPPAGHEDTPGS